MPDLDPSRTALLVMDYQRGLISGMPGSDDLVARVSGALDGARRAGLTVGHVRVGFTADDLAGMGETSGMAERARLRGDALNADSPLTQIDERLAPTDGEIIVRKVRIGAFTTTNLEIQLRDRGVDTLVLAGIATSGVVLSTVRDAYDRDFRPIVLSDGCADPDAEVHAFLMERVLARQAEVTTIAELIAALGA